MPQRVTSQTGKFLVLDGPEGCGKSTQAQLLRQRLQSLGQEAILVRDPGSTPTGEQIRALLLNPASGDINMRCEMLLYMAARAQMMAQIILPSLHSGQTVICDRFVSSTLAYQLGGDGLTSDDIRKTAAIAIRDRWPDLTIILDLPVEQAMSRINRQKDRIEQRSREYHEQVRRNYLDQAAADPKHYRVIAADRPPEAVHADIWKEISNL
jgi:dTMP kinase